MIVDNMGVAQKTRVFFSIHVPDSVGSRLVDDLRDLPLAIYPKENLHSTLKFVGDVNEKEMQKLIAITSEIARNTPALEMVPQDFLLDEERLRLSVRPDRELMRLYGELVVNLHKRSIGEEEKVPFAPHITLGRTSPDIDVAGIKLKPEDYAFRASEFGLYQSEQGENNLGEYKLIKSFPLEGLIQTQPERTYNKIILPTRPQPDTLAAIFILKKFGDLHFPGIKEALVEFWQVLPEGETEQTLDAKGVILIDIGEGRFDHHGGSAKVSASDLVSKYLAVDMDPALAKLLEYARRDDFFGKGTVSEDPLDRAFGLSAIVANLNKSLVKNPAKVVDIVLPVFIAHYNEELKRVKELPKEFEDKLKNGEAETFEVRQRSKKLKVVMVLSASGSLAGYLRSQIGGRFDAVAQILPSGHVNILTRPVKRIDLRSLAMLLRLEEGTKAGIELEMTPHRLAASGRLEQIPEWYYDPATNSIQNGGLNPKEIAPTRIGRAELKKIIELGLSEQVWSPLHGR